MRAVIIKREGAWQVRITAGDKLPVHLDETELVCVAQSEQSAVEKCFDHDDFNTATYVFLDGE